MTFNPRKLTTENKQELRHYTKDQITEQFPATKSNPPNLKPHISMDNEAQKSKKKKKK